MSFFHEVWQLLTNLQETIPRWSNAMGGWFYAAMAAIVFAETGLVVTPFLPGDALLFALGVLAAQPGSGIDPWLMALILNCAALCGDNSNYWIGRKLGPRVFTSASSRLLNKDHLIKAQRFYEKHGAKTIVLARFIAIIRTFAPFVAGVGKMEYRRFLAWSVGGALLWVWGFIALGYSLGNVAWVQRNFDALVWGIMGFTVVLGVMEYVKAKRRKRAEAAAADEGTA